MTREDMLKKMGIGDGDFRDYLTKLSAFRNSLNAAQRAFFDGGKPTVDQMAKWFGPDATAGDVEKLFAEAPPQNGIICTEWRR
ncbi:MAG TPA: hypothetical protein VK819_11380 [Acidobacteriaceae bacterium]|jgi:hypothetical protein|nr:hypothetical protein [Acidobacteriaceae bacterium]